jgi:hypothetical protein
LLKCERADFPDSINFSLTIALCFVVTVRKSVSGTNWVHLSDGLGDAILVSLAIILCF